MEARLTGGNGATVNNNPTTGGINPRDLNPSTYRYYCRLYLIEKIYEVVPVSSNIEYRHVSKLINCIDPVLFDNLYIETNKVILLNMIYNIFMEAANQPIAKEFLYEKINHIASYDPVLYQQQNK